MANKSSIGVSIRSRQQEGSCNSCQRRDQEKVILVDVKGFSFRLCMECAEELTGQLTKLESKGKSKVKIKVQSVSKVDHRKNIVFETKEGAFRICGYDMLPHKMAYDGVTYERIQWEEFRRVVTDCRPRTECAPVQAGEKRFKIKKVKPLGDSNFTMVITNEALIHGSRDKDDFVEYPLTRGREKFEMDKMRRALKNHLDNGGTFSNYPW